MGRSKHKKTQIPIDVVSLTEMIKEADVTFYQIEKDLKIGNGIVSRGLKEGTSRPIPPKWNLPLVKYLKKKITDKRDAEVQTTEVLQELGFKTPEQESNLKEELKDVKRTWVDRLQS